MVAFCTHCWKEIDARLRQCPYCGAMVEDTRTYDEKIVGALRHPLPSARARICWLAGENRVTAAVPALMNAAERDPDLYVQKAAIEALGALADQRALPVLQRVRDGANRMLATVARRSLEAMSRGKSTESEAGMQEHM